MMRVDRSSLQAFSKMIDELKSLNAAVLFLFKRVLLDSYFQVDFQNKILLMMARKPPEQLTPALRTEFFKQVSLLLWILGPIWVAHNEQLPVITLERFKEAISNESANDWDVFYSQFGEHDKLWQEIIDDMVKRLEIPTSRIIVGRIARIIMENLPEPMHVH